MSSSLIVILLMALTVTVAIGIAMASTAKEGSKLFLFEAKDPRQEGIKLKFEVTSNSYVEALESANEVKHMYREDGIELEWIAAYELDPESKNKISLVFKQTELGIEKKLVQ